MKLDYLKCIRKYLSETRENLGVPGFSIASSFNPKSIYGITKENLLISDINSVYIINNFRLLDEYFISIFNRRLLKLGNVDDFIYDLSKYPLSLEKVPNTKLDELLTSEQRYFYETILRDNSKSDIQSYYDEKEKVLVGFSGFGCGYVYAPTLKSTNCR